MSPAVPQPSRTELLARLEGEPTFDLVVIGGGATGLGVAVDAAARGLSVALFEAEDFAKGTSSRATKLVHGGVRYLAQGNVRLVREALRERAILLGNAPHLVQRLPFVIPACGWRGRLWDRWFYAAGLRLYDALAGAASLGPTRLLSRKAVLDTLPGVQADGLVGGVEYQDAQFDDARLAVALARTAIRQGGIALNYCRVAGFVTGDGGRIAGVEVEDRETLRRFTVRAGCVVNATGVWVDDIRRLDDPAAAGMVTPSQGAHVVVDRSFLSGDSALLVPKTADGRVLFAVPWEGSVILGTTDTPRADHPLEPRPLEEEVAFILREAGRLLARRPTPADVRSVWAGLRPLVRPPRGGFETKSMSREHVVVVSPRGLVTVTGGKWTTYRAMAEDVLATCMGRGLLPARPAGITRTLRLVGATDADSHRSLTAPPGLHLYGSEAAVVAALPGADRTLSPGLTEAMVRFAARHEYARSVEDVLARRSRLLFRDAAQAATAADPVAAILAEELGPGFDAPASAHGFVHLAASYCLNGT
ncbi:MAG: glycerol-3-phosphate dehydrogenase/oxidase [Pirellulales bacterium]